MRTGEHQVVSASVNRCERQAFKRKEPPVVDSRAGYSAQPRFPSPTGDVVQPFEVRL